MKELSEKRKGAVGGDGVGMRVKCGELLNELEMNKELVEDLPDSSDGSDSEPSEDNLDEVELKKYILVIAKKRAVVKTKTKKPFDKTKEDLK